MQGVEAGHRRVLVEDVFRRGPRARAPGMAEESARTRPVRLRVRLHGLLAEQVPGQRGDSLRGDGRVNASALAEEQAPQGRPPRRGRGASRDVQPGERRVLRVGAGPRGGGRPRPGARRRHREEGGQVRQAALRDAARQARLRLERADAGRATSRRRGRRRGASGRCRATWATRCPTWR